MTKLYKVCLMTVFSAGLVMTAQAATYKWVDKDGKVHYSQQPPAGTNYEKMKVKPAQPSSGTTPASQPATGTSPAASGASDKRTSKILKEEAAKNTELRAQNCEQAKKSLELYTVFRRVRDKDGNVTVLDDNERAERIKEAKAGIQEFCD